ncbi:DeoR/GlpR family DNA-binding transcription regulator [Paenibacillus periandrae]|uniref:DeoR/GlpR family DNA-binding transcription regulator n=1 Tax=Paenibacillus periandrae TaxID=1761741 RepID=UPI001F09C6FD|nr:DeoR/GlpR family DNA-binding transcription regulator [Paenibacillus periandrae]
MSMKAKQRRINILSLIEREGSVNVEELAEQYSISVETIRRDLRILNDEGFAQRTYGGALRTEKVATSFPFHESLGTNREQKAAIGGEAAKLVAPGDNIFIDDSTLGLAFARNIPSDLEITVVTTSYNVALYLLNKNERAKVYVTGGELDKDGITRDPRMYLELRKYSIDKAFFSAIAVNERGSFHSTVEYQQLAHTLEEVSQSLILLSDYPKMEKNAFFFGLKLQQFSFLITDEGASPFFLDKVKKTGCQVITASCS